MPDRAARPEARPSGIGDEAPPAFHDAGVGGGAPSISSSLFVLPDRQEALRIIRLELAGWDCRFDSAETIAEAIVDHLSEASQD